MSRLFALIFLLWVLVPLTICAAPLADYTATFRPVLAQDGVAQVMIRSFRQDGTAMALLVNPRTLATTLAAQADLTELSATRVEETPYLHTVRAATASPVRLQNHGLTHARQPVDGQFLTVDLCPSKRPFEQAFFEAVAKGSSRPVPVAVAITGAWLRSHEREFVWLREQERTGRLAITWVNHSLTHPYEPGAPLAQTFLLTPGLDRRREILAVEQALLERGVVPSVFFRFPGLVADSAVMDLLRELGLIPIGSDAWLAKGESPRPGSIILVHGNGNEPAGIRLFHDLQRRGALSAFLPLAQAVVPYLPLSALSMPAGKGVGTRGD
jgi:hypothetical protein